MTFKGERILLVYKYLGLTQKQFAEQVGFSRKRIQDYVNGAEISSRFLQSVEKRFPEININYLRNRADNMFNEPLSPMVTDSENDSVYTCPNCKVKSERIRDLENRISDKEEIIAALREQLKLYKEKLGDCEGLSKQA
ncbi:MAG: helix-turn-helix domain-containing protein [Bacteroidota bacterium]